MELVRVALTKGTLLVPPTYFALSHALAMPELDWRVFTLAARIFALNTTRSQPLSLALSLGTSRSVTPFDVMSRKTCTLLLDLLLFPSKHTSLIIVGPQALRIWIPRSLPLFPTCHASHAEASCKGNSVTWRAY